MPQDRRPAPDGAEDAVHVGVPQTPGEPFGEQLRGHVVEGFRPACDLAEEALLVEELAGLADVDGLHPQRQGDRLDLRLAGYRWERPHLERPPVRLELAAEELLEGLAQLRLTPRPGRCRRVGVPHLDGATEETQELGVATRLLHQQLPELDGQARRQQLHARLVI